MNYQRRDLNKRQQRAAHWLAEHSQEDVVSVDAPKKMPPDPRRLAYPPNQNVTEQGDQNVTKQGKD